MLEEITSISDRLTRKCPHEAQPPWVVGSGRVVNDISYFRPRLP